MIRIAIPAMTLAGLATVGALALGGGQSGKGNPKPSGSQLGKLSSTSFTMQQKFIENDGQWDSRAKFGLRTAGINTWVTENSIVFDAYRVRNLTSVQETLKNPRRKPDLRRSGQVFSLEFVGGQPGQALGVGQLNGKANFLVSGSQSSASVFNETKLVGVYPGVDVRLYVDSGSPRYDLIVAPGADPSQIQLRFNGVNGVQSSSPTDLRLNTNLGAINMGGLFAYQMVGGQRKQVPASFVVMPNKQVRFNLGSYNPNLPLVIDPIVYSTLLGGVGTDRAIGVAVDALTSAYVCGFTESFTFPVTIGAYDELVQSIDGFVTKFTPDGTDVEYSTYIGGDTDDFALKIAVDAFGFAYIAGFTDSTDFDASAGSFQQTNAGGVDGFVAKLAQNGQSLVWATHLGGTDDDFINDIAIDTSDNVYVVGDTISTDLPISTTFQGTIKGDGDGFIAKLSADGSTLDYSSYVGGTDLPGPNDDDTSVSVAVDTEGFAYVLTRTRFSDAPTTPGAFDRTPSNNDNHVIKISQDGSAVVWGTFVGGSGSEGPTALALDRTNNVLITGTTNSFNYPRSFGAFDRTYNNATDAFLTKINRLGNGLVFSTYLGASNGWNPQDLAVDDLGFSHIGGVQVQTTQEPQLLPVTANADDPTFNGPFTALPPGLDAALQVINDTGSGQIYCSYWGGSQMDLGWGVAIDGARNAYLVGSTQSSLEQTIPFPTTPDAFKRSFPPDNIPNPSFEDGFLTKIKTRIPITIQSLAIAPNSVAAGEQSTGTVTLSGPASTGGATVSLTSNNPSVVSMVNSFIIPEGQTNGTFTIDTATTLTVATPVRVFATVEGDTKFADITVSPWLVALTLSNDTVVGGNLVGGRVTIFRPAPNGGITVNMASTVPAVATVPATVIVPQGLTTATFDVSTVGVTADSVVDITASYGGLTRTVTLTVIPARLFSISFVPTVVSGGTPIQGKVQLDGNAPIGGHTVNLTVSDPALTVPATVVIAPQTQSVTFDAQTAFVSNNTSVTVDATLGIDTVSTVVDILRANLTSFTVNPNSVQGGNSVTGTVGLDAPAATGGVTIPITSSNNAIAQVPATVTIPSGSTNTTFVITTAVVASTTNVTLNATRGPASIDAVLEVRAISFTLSVDPSSVVGGASATGTVTLTEPAPAAGVTIALSSDNGNVTVPSSVTFLSGEQVQTFQVTTVPVVSTITATVTGTFLSSSASDTLEVRAPGVLNLSINPTAVSGGANATGTVQLNGVAPAGGVTVNLSSNNAAATVPASVTVLAGSTTRTFTITTIAVASPTLVTITATANSESDNATLLVTSANLISITFSPNRVRGGQTTTMTVTLDAGAPPAGALVTLTSSNPSLANIPGSVTILPGQTSRSVTVLTRRVSRTLVTQVSATYNGNTVFASLSVTR